MEHVLYAEILIWHVLYVGWIGQIKRRYIFGQECSNISDFMARLEILHKNELLYKQGSIFLDVAVVEFLKLANNGPAS